MDLRVAARELKRSPGFAATAVLSLALGIAATTAVFSVIHAVLLNPFPYPGSDRIMQLQMIDKAGRFRGTGFTYEQMEQIQRTGSFESAVAEDGWNLTTTDSDLPEDVVAAYIATNAPRHWDVPAMLGRWFIPSDAPLGNEPERAVVLSYRFWQRYYGGDPAIVGRTIQLVRKNYQILGVMPPRYRWREADIYVPLKVVADANAYYGWTLKLKPGVTPERANAQLQPILETFARAAPTRYPESFKVRLRSIIELFAKPLESRLYLLFGAVASLLLIGCANVSILLLARGARRQHELAVRSALGAGRKRIVRQLLTGSLVIAAAGGLLGVALAWKGLALLVAWIPENSYPAETVIEMNLPVLVFSTGLAMVTALIFGMLPALQLSRPDVGAVMQANTRRIMGSAAGKRTHGLMVAGQVALTLLILSVAGTAGREFMRLVNADLGYDPRNTMSLPIPIHENTYGTWKERSEYFERIRAGVAAMPQVVAAGISTNATPPSSGWETRIELAGLSGGERPEVRVNFVSPEYFNVLRIPLLQGRLWDEPETRRGAPLALVNQTMARQLWPDGNVLGQQFKLPNMQHQPPYQPAAETSAGWMQVIGIVADSRNDGLRNPAKPAIYIPYGAKMRMFTQILVRTKVPPLSILQDVRRELVRIDREQQVMRVRDLEGWITSLQEYSQQRLIAGLFGVFSALALILAAIGIYSVVSYGVATRTNEFGIRIALGAQRPDVMRIALSATMRHIAAGLVLGVVAAVAFHRAAVAWWPATKLEPWVLVGVGFVMAAMATVACLLPAGRAAAVDPMTALRAE